MCLHVFIKQASPKKKIKKCDRPRRELLEGGWGGRGERRQGGEKQEGRAEGGYESKRRCAGVCRRGTYRKRSKAEVGGGEGSKKDMGAEGRKQKNNGGNKGPEDIGNVGCVGLPTEHPST